MASLKELKTRISSVKATQKITKAMKMVAAAKLRRAQEAALSARPYAEKMGEVTANLCEANAGSDTAPKLLIGTGADQTHLLIVCTAERGLCGGFNSSIVRNARDHAQRLLDQGKTVKILCVGSKGYDVLKRIFSDFIIEVIEFRDVKSISFQEAVQVGDNVMARFDLGEFDVATLFYSEFKSVISQIPQAQQIIPATYEASQDNASGPKGIYEYEPGEDALLETMLPANIRVQIFRALLENAASEQGARMSAMDNATRNAGEMIDKLTLVYNRTRQAIITKELIEIISGAEAL